MHKRAVHTATNAASTELAIQDFLDAHPDYDVCCTIQATSPLLKPADFCRAFRLFAEQKADSLVTAVRSHRFLWSVAASTKFANAENYDPLRRPRHEEWDGELIENGAFYLFSKAHWDMSMKGDIIEIYLAGLRGETVFRDTLQVCLDADGLALPTIYTYLNDLCGLVHYLNACLITGCVKGSGNRVYRLVSFPEFASHPFVQIWTDGDKSCCLHALFCSGVESTLQLTSLKSSSLS